MSVVPRLLEKLYDKIIAKGQDLTGIKKVYFSGQLNWEKNGNLYNQNGGLYNLKLKIARKLYLKMARSPWWQLKNNGFQSVRSTQIIKGIL